MTVFEQPVRPRGGSGGSGGHGIGATVLGTLVGAAAGALVAVVAGLVIASFVADEDAVEGALVVAVLIAAELGAVAGCAGALRAGRHRAAGWTAAVAAAGLPLVLLALRALSTPSVAPYWLSEGGVPFLGLAVLLVVPVGVLTAVAWAGRLLVTRLVPAYGN